MKVVLRRSSVWAVRGGFKEEEMDGQTKPLKRSFFPRKKNKEEEEEEVVTVQTSTHSDSDDFRPISSNQLGMTLHSQQVERQRKCIQKEEEHFNVPQSSVTFRLKRGFKKRKKIKFWKSLDLRLRLRSSSFRF